MSPVAIGNPRLIGDAAVQYVGDRSHSHEGGHRITMAGREVLVQGDGRTTARGRSHVITRALHALSAGETLPVEALVGALVLGGASNVEVDGQPMLGRAPDQVAVLRLEVSGDGTISVASIGGSAS